MKTTLLSAVAICALAAFPLAAQNLGTPPAPAQGTFGATPQSPQQAPAPQDQGAGLPTGEVVSSEPQIGETYLRGRFGDWSVACVKAPEAENEPCRMIQPLFDERGGAVAEVRIFDVPDDDASGVVAGAFIFSPLGTLLTEKLGLQIEDGQSKRYDFQVCDAAGCLAQVGLTSEELEAMQAGSRATVRIVAVQQPNVPILLTMSLSGFTAAFEDISAAN